MLAVFDLLVGVSNDAVNFMNSAVGAKVAKFRTIVIVAAVGVFVGAIMSNGMMDIARHGIFQPSNFSFYEIMCIQHPRASNLYHGLDGLRAFRRYIHLGNPENLRRRDRHVFVRRHDEYRKGVLGDYGNLPLSGYRIYSRYSGTIHFPLDFQFQL